MTPQQRRTRFFELHAREQVFVMPNPWDVGSTKLLTGLGFDALATTSAGFAWSDGRDDYGITLDQLVEHTRAVAASTHLPLNVDSERCFADDGDLTAIGHTVGLLHDAGAAGCSIEDWNGPARRIDPIDVATERVAAAAEAAHRDGDPMLLTARCENFLHGVTDLDDTIERLIAYASAGADCVYAPGLNTVDQIERVANAVDVPINVLALPGGPTVAEIGAAGGRRVSIGSSLASTAYGAMMAGARELIETGTSSYLATRLTGEDRRLLG